VRGDPSPRYRFSWDDGHESIYTTAAGSLHKVESEQATKGAYPGMSHNLELMIPASGQPNKRL
jgi:hypothetical protein